MKRAVKAAGFGFILLLLYLLLWPVPLKPIAWNAPDNKGYSGDFAVNTKLADLNHLSIGARHGPEDVAAHMSEAGLRLYVSSQNGDIVEIDPALDTHRLFAQTGGVPLGLEFDAVGNLIIADAHKGLLSVSLLGEVEVLTDAAAGRPILYADDVDVAPDGVIYFTDASTKFGAKAAGSTMKGSVMEIFEHACTGRILAYDPKDKMSYEIADNLSFPNGIAIEPEGRSLLFIETGEYRLRRLYLTGDRAGEIETVYENFPGFPDNINKAPALPSGAPSYYIGLVSPRNQMADNMSTRPFLRKIIWRLPDFMKPQAAHYSHLVRIDANGRIISSWQDPAGTYPLVTGAVMSGGQVYLSSLGAKTLGFRAFEK